MAVNFSKVGHLSCVVVLREMTWQKIIPLYFSLIENILSNKNPSEWLAPLQAHDTLLWVIKRVTGYYTLLFLEENGQSTETKKQNKTIFSL